MQEPQRTQKKSISLRKALADKAQRDAEKCIDNPCETLRPWRLCLACRSMRRQAVKNCALSYETPTY